MKLTESMTIIFPTALWAIMIAKLISPIILNLIVTLHLQDPIKIPLYNTFTTNNADERHTGSSIAIHYTTVSLYPTTEFPHHQHSPHITTTTESPHHFFTFLFLLFFIFKISPDIHGITSILVTSPHPHTVTGTLPYLHTHCITTLPTTLHLQLFLKHRI